MLVFMETGPPVLSVRAGLPHVQRLIRAHRPIRVVYFGGSITEGAGASRPEAAYPTLVSQAIAQRSGAPVDTVNASIGGTGAVLGAYRTDADVIAARPDLVVVEFSVNDWTADKPTTQRSLEAIIRNIRVASPATDIVFVYAFVSGHLDEYRSGRTPKLIPWHDAVAAHYGIPSVNVSRFVVSRFGTNLGGLKPYFEDGIHPTDAGFGLYRDAMLPLLGAASRPWPSLPNPLTKNPPMRATSVKPTVAKFTGAWQREAASPIPRFRSVAQTDDPSASATLDFEGTAVGMIGPPGPDAGNIMISLDGGPWKLRRNFFDWSAKWYATDYQMFFQGLPPGRHRLKIRPAPNVPAGSKGRFLRIGAFLIDGKPVGLAS